MNILLKGATIIDEKSRFHNTIKDILIVDGYIRTVTETIPTQAKTSVVELHNLHISPGWFDSSISLGEPGFEERETLDHGLGVAARSGFTDVALNPNTYPVIDTQSDITFLKSKERGHATSLHPIGALTLRSEGVELAELYDMKKAGAVAFGDYKVPVSNANLLKVSLQYAQPFGALVLSFPFQEEIAGKGVANEEVSATRLGLKGIPALSETLQIIRDVHILEYTGGKLHIPTISVADSVQIIEEAKDKGLNISCSVSVHHLSITDDELHAFDTCYKVLPPLRTKKDIDALLTGIDNGTIDMVTSDHNPINVEHKKVEFDHALYGTIGLESAFGVLNNLLGMEKTVGLLTAGKERFGIERTTIAEGAKASLSLFDPEGIHIFDKSHILSSSKNSAFLGMELKGKAYGIVNEGQLVLNT